MDKIFVPNLSDYQCVVVRDNNTIRAYSTMPQINNSSNYVDYYPNSHYMYSYGTQTWSNYQTLPSCYNTDNLTSDFWYRNDMPEIMILFLSICFVSFFFPWKILTRIFRRWS